MLHIIRLKNIETTTKVVEYAHSKGVSVEAELGVVGGQEDDVVADGVIYADPKECEELVKRTGIDALAPALGSVHGPYKGEPNLGFKEMEEVRDATGVPLVLHGGTGIPTKDIQKAISLGTAKINVNTENQIESTKRIREILDADKEVYDPRKYLGPAREVIKATVIGKIREFGSSGKA
jgi:fructose-bisphosphate aldolase class II